MDLLALFGLLYARRKPSIVSLTTETVPSGMLKRNRLTGETNPYNGAKVTRIAQRRAIVGANYASCVDRQREREFLDLPAYRPDALWHGYGVHMDDTILVTHKDKGGVYLPYRPHTVAGEVSADHEEWFADGQPIERVPPEYFPLRTGSGRQGTVATVPWRTVLAENILQLRYARDEYNRPE